MTQEQEHHARFSPSKLSRILACTGSIVLEERALQEGLIQAEKTSSYAAEGTRKHELIAKALLAYKQGYKVRSMETDVQECFDYAVFLLKASTNADIYGIELVVSLEDNDCTNITDVYGTVDCVIIDNVNFVIHIIDWKFGYNKIDVKDNHQLLAYAAGVCKDMLTHTDILAYNYKLHIVQPVINHYESIDINVQQLNNWMNSTRNILEQIHKNNITFNPSVNSCKWCKAAPICKANHVYNTQIAEEVFKVYTNIIDDTDDILKPESFFGILEKSKAYTAYTKVIHDYIQEQLNINGSFPGYKLVAGKTTRKWKNEKAVDKWIEEDSQIDTTDIYEVKMKSPAKLEKMYTKYKKDKEFIALYNSYNKPIVVNVDDKRPEYAATTVFDEYKD